MLLERRDDRAYDRDRRQLHERQNADVVLLTGRAEDDHVHRVRDAHKHDQRVAEHPAAALEPTPESTHRPASAIAPPAMVDLRGRLRSKTACSSGVMTTYSPVMNAARAGVVSRGAVEPPRLQDVARREEHARQQPHLQVGASAAPEHAADDRRHERDRCDAKRHARNAYIG